MKVFSYRKKTLNYLIIQIYKLCNTSILNCHFGWYALSLFVTNVKHDKHTIRIMLNYDYKYAFLLDKLRNG